MFVLVFACVFSKLRLERDLKWVRSTPQWTCGMHYIYEMLNYIWNTAHLYVLVQSGWGCLRHGDVTQTHEKMAAALSSEFSDLVQIKKQLISMISQCKERGLVHSVKW